MAWIFGNDLDNLPHLRFKIESIEPNTATSNHFIVNGENCEFKINLKQKTRQNQNINYIENKR